MPVEKTPVHSATELLQSMENLIALQMAGVLDVREQLAAAIEAFDALACESIADALAFISLSRRMGQSLALQLSQGILPDQEVIQTADRYMDAAVAFLQSEETRRQHGHFSGYTLH